MTDALLPAVVLGVDTPIGLAIIRDLGVRGVNVHGIARNANAIGLSSRFLGEGHIRAAGEEPLIKQLLDLGERLGDSCLFAISEADITLLNRHRKRLVRFRMMFADEVRMNRVINKELTYVVAKNVGIRVPRTEQVNSITEAASACKMLRFPVVLKWANPNYASKTLSRFGLALEKAHYCYSAEELLAYLQPFHAVGAFPLIQEYCAGVGLGQFVLMQDKKAQFVFQHQRVHEWPPEGGFSSLCESVSLNTHQALMEKSIQLLRELEWDGIAMVEYRHDPKTGEYALMEVNGRFWGSLPLACHAGASFPWFVYQLLGLNLPVEQKEFKAGVRCRFMVPETKRLLTVLFNQRKIRDRQLRFSRLSEILQFLVDFIRPNTCYFVFDRRDPGPFISDFLRGIRLVPQTLKREKRA